MSYLDWPVDQIAVEVLARKKLDKQSILNELSQLDKRKVQTLDFESQSNQEVIEYILQRYHEVHREQFSELQPKFRS